VGNGSDRVEPAGVAPPDLEPADDLELVDVQIAERDWSGAPLARAEVTRCRFVGVRLAGACFEHARLAEVELVRCDLAGADLSEAALRRVRATDCRFTRAELPQAAVRESAFVDCRMEEVNLRLAKLEDVRFERCDLARAELHAARMTRVVFDGSGCAAIDFTKCESAEVDLRNARLGGARGFEYLRGAIIARDQVVPLALDFALALGLVVRDE
jgi:uncharacterized protein YjbI with pentapeptide repeats